MRTAKANDQEFEDHRIDSVRDEGDAFVICCDGWSLWTPKVAGITPKPGDTARQYGRGVGYSVRGVDINGSEVFYRTAAEQEAKEADDQLRRDLARQKEYCEQLEGYTARINALPGPQQKRLFQFRERDPNYGWQFEGYELTCSEVAARIAAACERRDGGEAKEWFERFQKLPYAEQVAICGPDDGWSGNMFGFATRQAWMLVTTPDLVSKDHGALCVLVGCDGFKVCDVAFSTRTG